MKHASVRAHILVACFFIATAAWAEITIEIEFAEDISQYTDGRIEAKGSRSQFDCGQRIHGVFRLENLAPGSRKIHTRWRGPNGRIERVNKREIRIRSAQQVVFLSSSIEFAGGDPLSSLFDPAAGFEPYIGLWNAEVLVDNILVKSGKFQVLC